MLKGLLISAGSLFGVATILFSIDYARTLYSSSKGDDRFIEVSSQSFGKNSVKVSVIKDSETNNCLLIVESSFRYGVEVINIECSQSITDSSTDTLQPTNNIYPKTCWDGFYIIDCKEEVNE